jgi:UDP-N-acetylmuramate dehydrogenase
VTILENIPLAPYTTFKVGGRARYLSVVKSEEELREALAFAREKALPVFVLGGGSNLVVSDEGFPGVVVKMEMAGASYEKVNNDILVTAWAGESWDELVAKTVEWGAWGLENLSLIPGTVGAAPVQNIGAYGAEAKDAIESVRAVDRETGVAKTFSNAECRFSYRESFFKTAEGKRWIILSVTFRLSATPRPNLSYKDLAEYFTAAGDKAAPSRPSQAEIRDAVIEIRTGKFPDLSKTGTAGSFWKNPVISREHFERLAVIYPGMPSFPVARNDLVKVPLAWILDKVCGLKGYARGNVRLFEKQPLVLVAERGASAAEIQALEAEIRALVKDKTAIDIEPEVGFLG